MNITSVTVHGRPNPDKGFLGLASVVLNDAIAIHGIKILKRRDGSKLIEMPRRQRLDGSQADVVHPTNAQLRAELEQAVFAAVEGRK